jgi:hydroxymethylpyrimidine pyrophosphatase-like HAD family hydrolase
MRRTVEGTTSRPGPRLVAFAVDLDRTLLAPGAKSFRPATQTLKTVQRMGLRVVLVSGREHSVLSEFSDRLQHVDALVAENGGVIEAPVGGRVRSIGRSTGARVRERLAAEAWTDVEYGEVVVSLPRARESDLRARLNGLPVHLVPNVDRVMVLPEGVSKASGMRRALGALHLPSRTFAAIGDAENDIPLLRAASLSAAVRNAQPSVLAYVDYVCRASFGAGVAEFVREPLVRYLQAPARARSTRPTREVD